MPRTARAAVGGYCYHVINRGNGRAEVFHRKRTSTLFARLLRAGVAPTDMRLIGYCLLPNHFHLVLWPIRAIRYGFLFLFSDTHICRRRILPPHRSGQASCRLEDSMGAGIVASCSRKNQ